MTQTTTRRQLLRVGTSVAAYAAGAAIVTGGIAIAGEAKSQTPKNIDPALLALMAEVEPRNRAVDRHQREVLDRPALPHETEADRLKQVLDNNALNDAVSHAQYAVAAFPAATAIDLQAKLAFMVEHELGDGMDWLGEILEDVQRITSREAQA